MPRGLALDLRRRHDRELLGKRDAIGGSLLVAARARSRAPAAKALGIARAATLGGADLYFVATGQIPRIYLADAAAEAALIGLWIMD